MTKFIKLTAAGEPVHGLPLYLSVPSIRAIRGERPSGTFVETEGNGYRVQELLPDVIDLLRRAGAQIP